MKIYIYQRPSKYFSSKDFISMVLHTYYGIDKAEVCYKQDGFGKPFIGNSNNLHFNCSHSYEFIVCAISETAIGVDIEKIIRPREILVNKIFTPQEKEYVNSFSEFTSNRFTIIWTRKEAYAKWLGVGMQISIASEDCLHKQYIRTFHFNDYYISIYSSEIYNYLDSFVMIDYQGIIEEVDGLSLGGSLKCIHSET